MVLKSGYSPDWSNFSCCNLVNSPIQDYVQPDDHAQLTYEITPRFKPFTDKYYHAINKTTNK